jgi:hypothetical protein
MRKALVELAIDALAYVDPLVASDRVILKQVNALIIDMPSDAQAETARIVARKANNEDIFPKVFNYFRDEMIFNETSLQEEIPLFEHLLMSWGDHPQTRHLLREHLEHLVKQGEQWVAEERGRWRNFVPGLI